MADAAPPPPPTREPEKLVLPAAAVRYLLELALRTQLGEAWWLGFTTAHGAPTWIADRAFSFRTEPVAVVRTEPPGGAG